MSVIKPLERLDILITIFNQEEIIERVLYSVLKNTTTAFNLILVFDGCKDRTQPRAISYLKKFKSRFLLELVTRETPNLFETRANIFGFKLSMSDYLITIQDDMVIREYGWEKRITYPLRKFDDVFAVSARSAQDIISIGNGREQYVHQAAFETQTLTRDIFAVRDVGIRGPLAFRMEYLRELNYLNEKYAPCALDDTELSLRAWVTKRWKIGAFGIDYLSKREWSKVSAPDSTMKTWETWRRNLDYLANDYREYLAKGIKHTEDIVIPVSEIDYQKSFLIQIRKFLWILPYPLRLDKRRMMVVWNTSFYNIIAAIKYPLIQVLKLIFGNKFVAFVDQHGFKKAIVNKVGK